MRWFFILLIVAIVGFLSMIGVSLSFLRFTGAEKAPPNVVALIDGINLMTTRHRGAPGPLGQMIARDGTVGDLTFFHGKIVLLYLWSPGKTITSLIEFEGFAKLQAAVNNPDFALVAVAVGPDGWAGVDQFSQIAKITTPVFVDAAKSGNSVFKFFPLPTTLLIDRKGYEIARLNGPAFWDSPRAVDVINAALEDRL
jgi:hypothetical protein